MADSKQGRSKGVSLAKGPVGIMGIIGIAYGITGLIFGGRGFGGDDVLGIFAANGLTELVWGAAAAVLLVLALLPRVGAKEGDDDTRHQPERRVAREAEVA